MMEQREEIYIISPAEGLDRDPNFFCEKTRLKIVFRDFSPPFEHDHVFAEVAQLTDISRPMIV